MGTILGLERSPGEGNCNPPQDSCLENPMDRGAWGATVHGDKRVEHNLVTKTTRFFLYIILFIYDLAALGLSCGTWDLVP